MFGFATNEWEIVGMAETKMTKIDLAAAGFRVASLEWKDQKAMFEDEGPTYSEAVGAGYTYVAEAVDMTLEQAKAERQAKFERFVLSSIVSGDGK